MSNFMKTHLQQSSVDSSCVSPEPVRPYMGPFFPPEFSMLEGPRRGQVFDWNGRPVKQMNQFDKTAFKVIGEVDGNSGTIELINP